MKNVFTIIFTIFLVLNAQSAEQIKKKLQDVNVTPDQAKQMAKDRGMTDQQIEAEAQVRGIESEPVTSDKPAIKTTIESQVELELEESTIPETPEVEMAVEEELDVVEEELVLETTAELSREGTSYYGYQIFQGDPSVFQASTFGRVDPNYNIGPEDQVIVLLWGEAQFRQEYIVDREGNIFLEDVGPVSVNGLTIKTLEKKLFRIFSMLYSTLNPITGPSTTFMDISLGSLRPLRVIVLGEVAQPGAYTVSPSTSLSSVLYYFRGPTTMGSLREIHLIRQGKTMGTLDFYNYLLSGKTPNDLRLQLDDIVFIPPRGKTVTISGEINRPAIYELKEGEMLTDLIKIAGNLRITTYMDRAQIDRIVVPELRYELGMDRMLVDINLEEIMKSKDDYPIQDGDHVRLFSILKMRENTVTISGSVVRPGTYDLGDGLRLKDLIQRAKGLIGDAYLERADVVRVNADFTEKLLKLDIQAVMDNSADHNMLLQPMDRVRIYSLTEMVAPRFVSINGYVQNPGRYPLRDNMNLYDLVFYGGGLADDEWLDKAFMGRADLIRQDKDNITSRVIPFDLGELINNPDDPSKNWTLQTEDNVRIYSNAIFNVAKDININGSVNSPGVYTLKSNMTIKDLILEAGGVSKDVYSYKIEVARIDPTNTNKNIYAQILTLDMANDFSLSNIQYQSPSNPVVLSVKRNEFELQPYDRISIRPDPNFSLHRTVIISGEINYPGSYVLIKPKEKVLDIIRRAGGLRKEAYPMSSNIIRNDRQIRVSFDKIFEYEASKDNFELLDGDRIIINSHPNLVEVIGEVHAPGVYKYYVNKNVRGYIALAGGLTTEAEKRNIWVNYPDGTSKQLKRFWPAPKIYDGALITVGEEEETEPIDKTELAKEVASIVADFLQIYITLILLWSTASTT